MSIFYNLQGPERKRLVEAISEILKLPAIYNGAPTFSYTVGDYTVDRFGTVTRHTGFNDRQTDTLTAALAERGFEETDPGDTTPETPALVRNRPWSVEAPLEGFTELALDNLRKIVAGKETLIKKALGADSLPIEELDNRLRFPWFTLTGTAGEADAYIHFIAALCAMAQLRKRVSAKEREAENDKFTMRLFLVRLGFVGTENKTARKILLRHLTGNSAWKHGRRPETDAVNTDSDAENTQAEDAKEV